jgi:hypothetical protein
MAWFKSAGRYSIKLSGSPTPRRNESGSGPDFWSVRWSMALGRITCFQADDGGGSRRGYPPFPTRLASQGVSPPSKAVSLQGRSGC